MDLRAWNASSLLVRPELALAVTSSLYQTWVTKCLGELKRILGWLLHENSVDTYIYLITVYNIYIYYVYIYIYRWLTSMVSPIKKSRLGWRDSFQQLMKQTGTFPINQIPKSMTFHVSMNAGVVHGFSSDFPAITGSAALGPLPRRQARRLPRCRWRASWRRLGDVPWSWSVFSMAGMEFSG